MIADEKKKKLEQKNETESHYMEEVSKKTETKIKKSNETNVKTNKPKKSTSICTLL